ncbi:hypothetical protein LMG29542_08260 [Paraburkholderia humisilvae]|uniref:Uncharacterized protein n=1 Tax=Paraburkholderia humisilvae TaxID=627669 RepID=A0A6J5F7K2_9BURK|nr:hypothetical protein LMG29542_08260 [Paraburkholderia humisilvae]
MPEISDITGGYTPTISHESHNDWSLASVSDRGRQGLRLPTDQARGSAALGALPSYSAVVAQPSRSAPLLRTPAEQGRLLPTLRNLILLVKCSL